MFLNKDLNFEVIIKKISKIWPFTYPNQKLNYYFLLVMRLVKS